MLVPDIQNIQKESNSDNHVVIENINDFVDLHNFDIFDSEKELKKFVKNIESIIRTSIEYKSYIGFLKNELNITKCTFLPGVDVSEIKGVGLEFHHYPFTLYDIVLSVVQFHMDNGKVRINPFDIAEEVMLLHYKNLIGLVPLSKSVHELVHSGRKFVNLKYTLGKWERFLDFYSSAIPDDLKQNLENLKTMSKEEDNGEKMDSVLELNMMTLEMKDVSLPSKIKIEQDEIA